MRYFGFFRCEGLEVGSRQGGDSAYDCGRIGVNRGEAGELETVGPRNIDAEVAAASMPTAAVVRASEELSRKQPRLPAGFKYDAVY